MPQMCQSRPEKRNVDNELGTDVCTFSQNGASKKISIVWVMFGVFINGVLERAETSPKDVEKRSTVNRRDMLVTCCNI